eukprot:s1248_g14.t1
MHLRLDSMNIFHRPSGFQHCHQWCVGFSTQSRHDLWLHFGPTLDISESELYKFGMWRILRAACCYAWFAAPVLSADVTIEADGAVNSARKRRNTAPVLLQAKATLKRPESGDIVNQVQPEGKEARPTPRNDASDARAALPLSFLQEDATSLTEPAATAATGATAATASDEFLTEVLPMGAPNLPMPQAKVAPMPGTPVLMTPMSFQLLSVLTVLLMALVGTAFYRRPSRDRVTQQVKDLPVLLASDLAQRSIETGDGTQQWSQSGLVRLEGHVVLDAAPLTAPFSDKTCVFYSASVSHPRHDEIRQPPVAFSTKQTKFSLELQDAPGVRIQVTGDVSLFNMQTGQEEWQHAFTEAPKNWCSFVLNNLVSSTDASVHFKKCLDLGSDGVILDFRESALLLGSHVSCVGQVIKDANGRWSLRPWQPPAGQSKRWGAAGAMWSRKDCLAGSILISDNPDLHP